MKTLQYPVLLKILIELTGSPKGSQYHAMVNSVLPCANNGRHSGYTGVPIRLI